MFICSIWDLGQQVENVTWNLLDFWLSTSPEAQSLGLLNELLVGRVRFYAHHNRSLNEKPLSLQKTICLA